METCHHYLSLAAEDIPDAHTEFKCCPPIREKSNQDILWEALLNKDIDLIVSDHSPATPGVKCLTYGKTRGDFIKAAGGISSLQFGLPLFWTNCLQHGLQMKDVYRLMCANPAKLCGLDNQKGKIQVDMMQISVFGIQMKNLQLHQISFISKIRLILIWTEN